LWIRSSDWCAKENECKDSEGKRERSSVKTGEPGPGDVSGAWPFKSAMTVRDDDLVRAPSDGVLLDGEGNVGARTGLCC